MAPEPNFESMSFNLFPNNNNFSDNNQDPDVSFFVVNIRSLNTEYFSLPDVKIGFSKFESPDTFSVLHLNIRSLRKNFEDLKELYKTLNLKFSKVCFSETWADDDKLENDSLIQLPGYNVLHQIRKNCRGGGISVFVHDSLSFKRPEKFGINSEAVESLSIKISNKKCKNIILNRIYRPSNGDIETCENCFKNLFSKNDTVNKHNVLAGNFNLNVLDFENNKNVQNFMDYMFLYGMMPAINKPTRVTANMATAIDHIITNVIKETGFKTEILKTSISGHFAIILTFLICEKKNFIATKNQS